MGESDKNFHTFARYRAISGRIIGCVRRRFLNITLRWGGKKAVVRQIFPSGRPSKKASPNGEAFFVAPSDIISNLFLEDLEKIWELKKWIPDPCNPHLHYLKPEPEEGKEP